jgi:hypothetical protein
MAAAGQLRSGVNSQGLTVRVPFTYLLASIV